MAVRTRFAPSPTGFPHIGSLYQALFNYAWAKKHQGQFIIRIEDTDQERIIDGAEEAIYSDLDWLGITEDESPRMGGDFGPYKQSKRLDMYQEHADKLVEQGNAYYCFCTRERLAKLRKEQQKNKEPTMYDRHCLDLSQEDIDAKREEGVPYVIRMKIPRDRRIIVQDMVRGDIEFEGSGIDDQVILKSDGFPTYHLAVVVDDYHMQISDVIRGEEWISSLPKHKLLYEWFGWDMPTHTHTPILRNPDKSKMSKRHGHTHVKWYIEQGILPEALRNFLALMGWHPGKGTDASSDTSKPEVKENELFSLDEFIDAFRLQDLKSVGPIFDVTKLEWMNGEYIRMMSKDDLHEILYDYTQKYNNGDYPKDLVEYTIPLVQTRIKTLQEYDEYCRFFIEQPDEYEKDISGNDDVFKAIIKALEAIEKSDWIADNIGETLQGVAKDLDMSFGKFFMLVRIALTGKKVTPPTNESMEILGKDECIERFKNAQD